MQLHLETDELKLLADILLEQDQRKYADLVDKVLGHDLRLDTDELEQTADLLAAEERRMKGVIAQQTNPSQKDELQRRLALLEKVLERVNEACVMF
jgi:hypothetical protein